MSLKKKHNWERKHFEVTWMLLIVILLLSGSLFTDYGDNLITGALIGILPVENATICNDVTTCLNETITNCVNFVPANCTSICIGGNCTNQTTCGKIEQCTTEVVETCTTETVCEEFIKEIVEPVPEKIPEVVPTPTDINGTEELVESDPVSEVPSDINVNKTEIEKITDKQDMSAIKNKEDSTLGIAGGFLEIQKTVVAGSGFYTYINSTGTFNSTGCKTGPGKLDSGNLDDGMYKTTLGFPFPYFGEVKPADVAIYMDTNGRLSWDDATTDAAPSTTEMQDEQNIAALWQDLGNGGVNNESICTNQGSYPNRYAVFLWDSAWFNDAGTINISIKTTSSNNCFLNFQETSCNA